MPNSENKSLTDRIGFKTELALVTVFCALVSVAIWQLGWNDLETAFAATANGILVYIAVSIYESKKRSRDMEMSNTESE